MLGNNDRTVTFSQMLAGTDRCVGTEPKHYFPLRLQSFGLCQGSSTK